MNRHVTEEMTKKYEKAAQPLLIKEVNQDQNDSF